MFDRRPVSERHAAIGVFTAIGLFGAASFELLITGGFQPIAFPRVEEAAAAEAPLRVHMVDAQWTSPSYGMSGRVTPAAMTFEPDAYYEDVAFEDLAGDRRGRVSAAAMERDYDEVARDIEALYIETSNYRETPDYRDAADYEDAEPIDQDVPAPTTTYGEDVKKDEFTAYGIASPS